MNGTILESTKHWLVSRLQSDEFVQYCQYNTCRMLQSRHFNTMNDTILE
jgi:hypothetical protein